MVLFQLLLIGCVTTSKVPNQFQYRVEFVNENTGFKGYGKWNDSKSLIEEWIQFGNEKYPELKHTLGVKKVN